MQVEFNNHNSKDEGGHNIVITSNKHIPAATSYTKREGGSVLLINYLTYESKA